MKPSEIIRMAVNHPSYLTEDGENWLCLVASKMQSEQAISTFEEDRITDIIHDSLGSQDFLRAYLYETDKIGSRHTNYQSQEYKQAAARTLECLNALLVLLWKMQW